MPNNGFGLNIGGQNNIPSGQNNGFGLNLAGQNNWQINSQTPVQSSTQNPIQKILQIPGLNNNPPQHSGELSTVVGKIFNNLG